MKWVGLPASIKYDYSDLVDACEAEPDGTNIPVFDQNLRKQIGKYAKIKRKYRPTLRQVESWTKKFDQIVVICYWHSADEYSDGHYMLLSEPVCLGSWFRCINDGSSVMLRDRNTIKRYLRTRQKAKKRLPVAWFIKVNT